MRSLCHKILQNVSILLNADRGSLFLVQGKTSSADNPKKWVQENKKKVLAYPKKLKKRDCCTHKNNSIPVRSAAAASFWKLCLFFSVDFYFAKVRFYKNSLWILLRSIKFIKRISLRSIFSLKSFIFFNLCGNKLFTIKSMCLNDVELPYALKFMDTK